MKRYSYFQLIDLLDEGVDDEAALVHQALKAGLKLSPKEALELIYYDTGAERAIMAAVKEPFSAEQLAEIEDFLAEEPE